MTRMTPDSFSRRTRWRVAADQPGQLDVGAVRVLLQHGQQPDVNIVKLNSHRTIDYFA
jgi:hypothetical protein